MNKYPLDLIAYYDYYIIDDLKAIENLLYFILNSFLTNQIRHVMFVHKDDMYVKEIMDFFADASAKNQKYTCTFSGDCDVTMQLDVRGSSLLFRTIREQLINGIQLTTARRNTFGSANIGCQQSLTPANNQHAHDKVDSVLLPAKQYLVDKILNDFAHKFENAYTLIHYTDFINNYYRLPKSVIKSKYGINVKYYYFNAVTHVCEHAVNVEETVHVDSNSNDAQ